MSLESQIKWSQTQKGKPKLFLTGQMYRIDTVNEKKGTTRFRCVRRYCCANVHLDNLTKKITASNLVHNHSEMTDGQVAAKVAQRTMYERSRDFESDPGQIIHDISATLPEAAHPFMPSDKVLKRTIRNISSKMAPRRPQDLSSLVLPPAYKATCNGEEWLFYDSLLDENDPDSRILVFGTRKMIDRLSVAEVRLCFLLYLWLILIEILLLIC